MKRAIAVIVLVLGMALSAGAEVAVERGPNGSFKLLRVDTIAKQGRLYFWERGCNNGDYLNTGGDANGDLRPAAVTFAAGKYQPDPQPIVVWPRNTGYDLDIYFAVWTTANGWSAMQPLSQDTTMDEADVRMFLDPRGDAHAVWWSNTDVPGVWYAKYKDGLWSTPVLLSPADRDSRRPFFVYTEKTLYVNWEDWTVAPVTTTSQLKERFDP